jgi:thiamine-phosphate pyrophosphorylase
VQAAVTSGVDWVQIRERELEGAPLLALAEEVAAAVRRGARARKEEVRVLINRRIDVAAALPASGVHLGFDAMPPRAARHLLGPQAWLGLATHTPEEAVGAGHLGVDYVHLAPVFAPLSKRTERPPLGAAALRRAAAGRLPVLAQGGIDAGNAAQAIAAGAAGVAVTGAVLLSEDPGRAAQELRAALDG